MKVEEIMKLYFSHYTLRELSEKCGMHVSTLSKIMSGVNRTSVETAHTLGELLDKHPIFFLAPGWYEDDGTRLPSERFGELRAWKYGARAVTLKNRKLLGKE